MTEIWKDIPGLEARYQVSSLGRIRNAQTERIRTPAHDTDAYQIFTYWNNGKYTTLKVHRCVALAFLENPDGLPEVNHKDGNKNNNTVDNLEWCTTQANIRHAIQNGLRGCKKGRPVEQIKHGRVVRLFPSLAAASRATGIGTSSICAAARGRLRNGKARKTAGGYEWRYAKEEN